MSLNKTAFEEEMKRSDNIHRRREITKIENHIQECEREIEWWIGVSKMKGLDPSTKRTAKENAQNWRKIMGLRKRELALMKKKTWR